MRGAGCGSSSGAACASWGNIVLSIDVLVVPTMDLSMWRNPPALVGLSLLLYGLIWDTE